MRRALVIALAFVALSALAARPAGADRMRLVVPAYQYPTLGTLWADLAAAAPGVPVVAILNPGNGPGTFVDPNYTAAVNTLRAAGGEVYGYVYTHYATRGADTVLADAALYDAMYAVDGFFVDEVTADADPAHLAYYAGLVAGLHALGPQRPVLGNPGIVCDAGYVATAHFDQLLTFEHGDGYDAWTPAPWMLAQPASRFVNLVYARHDTSGLHAAIAYAARHRVGGVYVTDDSLPNPWDTTPAYWADEVATVAGTDVSANGSGVPAGGAGAAWRAENPARDLARFTLSAAAHARALVVLDAQGRRVRTLAIAPGATALAWDARDEAGCASPPGVYWARLEREPATARRFVLLR